MSEMTNPKISLEELCRLWGMEESLELFNLYHEISSTYVEVSEDENARLVSYVNKILDGELVLAGESRADDWERGWHENFELFRNSGNLEDLKPRYFGKIPQIRWMSKWIIPNDPELEYKLFGFLLDSITIKYMKYTENIYEFGCGTGHNLLRIRKINQTANLIGLDWAKSSQELVQEISSKVNDQRLTAQNFDYFNPHLDLQLEKDCVVVTIASLEQTGANFHGFIEYLASQECGLVIHIEPIAELLDEKNEIDMLSIRYFKKRNYLDGLLHHLKGMESDGRIEIVEARRSYIGSFFIEGYSIVVWKPLN
jgi:SAM-dependent methyltransferase